MGRAGQIWGIYTRSHKLNGFSDNSYSFPSNSVTSKETASDEEACSVVDDAETLCQPDSSSSHSPDPGNKDTVCRGQRCPDDTNSQFQNPIIGSTHHKEASREVSVAAAKTREPQGTCQRQEKSDISSQCVSSSSTEVPKSTLKPKILLVEDNKTIVMVTRSMMKLLGHSIDVVNNGVEAVRAVQHHNYDLLLMVLS